MQKCNFDYDLVIGEDCSTDKTKQICQEYALRNYEISLLSSETNLGMIPNFFRTLQSCTGKYIALCEGDDFWTDPYKLQKQVDFLEENPDYGLVHTDFDHNFLVAGLFKKNYWRNYIHRTKEDQEGYVFEKVIVNKTSIATNTACFRKEFIEQDVYYNLMKLNPMSGDFPLWCLIAYQSKIGYLAESTAVRNVLPKSLTQGQTTDTYLKFYESDFKVVEFLVKYYNLSVSVLHEPKLLYYKRTLSTYYGLRDEQAFSRFYNKLKNEGLPSTFDLRLMNLSFKLSSLNFFIRSYFYVKRKIRNNLYIGQLMNLLLKIRRII
jgi:glycosyltransferase involved in cell wall biosynthesis